MISSVSNEPVPGSLWFSCMSIRLRKQSVCQISRIAIRQRQDRGAVFRGTRSAEPLVCDFLDYPTPLWDPRKVRGCYYQTGNVAVMTVKAD